MIRVPRAELCAPLLCLFCQWRRSGSGLVGLIFVEPAFEESDGGEEVVAFGDEYVDGVEAFLAGEAGGEIVARFDGGAHLAAVGAEEAEVTFALFRRRAVGAEGGDGGSRQRSGSDEKTPPEQLRRGHVLPARVRAAQHTNLLILERRKQPKCRKTGFAVSPHDAASDFNSIALVGQTVAPIETDRDAQFASFCRSFCKRRLAIVCARSPGLK
jgi:hypothetical protein